MTAQVTNLVETAERLGRSTPAASLCYQGQVSGRAIEIAEALSAQANQQDRPRSGMPPPSAEMVDMSVGGFGNAALVYGGNPSAWLSQYQPNRHTFAQLRGGLDTA
jgi:hypothetical protein